MADELKFRRGTESENDNYTGYDGEITIDTNNSIIRLHDGSTSGGKPITSVFGPNQIYPPGYTYVIEEDNADHKTPEQLGLGTVGSASGNHWTLATLITADFGGGTLEFYTRTSTPFTEADVSGWTI